MPNWCQNRLTVQNAPESFWEFVKDGLSFDKIVPMPEELRNSVAPVADEEKSKYFLQKYAATDWYDWAVRNWGTKWDIVEDKIVPNKLNAVFFDTAWSPPIEAMTYLSKMFPEMTITLDYCELGNFFAGCATIKNGEVDDIISTGEGIHLIAQDVFGMELEEEVA